MLKTATTIAFISIAGQASAQGCPDFFRFVDFGIEGRDGVIYRGGPTFRAESLTGQSLLVTKRTECLEVREIAKDGHGNPIPVVARARYRPDRLETELTELSVAVVEDTKQAADENATAHLTSVVASSAQITRGADYLCANTQEPAALSCQVQSPFSVDAPLVVYCDAKRCGMPVLAIDERLLVQAQWPSGADFLSDPSAAGTEISGKIQAIYAFLKPLSSKL